MPSDRRVFLGLNDVGGHLWGLHEGLSRLGVESDVYYFERSLFDFPCTRDLSHHINHPNPWIKNARSLARLARSTESYDIYHFNFAKSFLPRNIDLPILKSLGKRVVVTFNGTSTRPRGWCLDHLPYSQFGLEGVPFSDAPIDDRVVRDRIAMWDRYADSVFCLNPDLCRHTKKGVFLPYAKYNYYTEIPRRKKRRDNKLIIAHAPSNRKVKGTDFFIDTLTRVTREHPRLELRLIENISNVEALREIARCDVLFDQLHVGWYGGVAVEAMTMGVPVMTFIREDDLQYVPAEMREALPIIRTSRETLREDLVHLSTRDDLRLISERSTSYVRTFHNPEKVASVVTRAYFS